MKKYLLVLLLILSSFFGGNVYSLEELNLYSPNYLVYDITDDKVILENNTETVTAIASLTKIMTSILAIENIDDLDAKVKYIDDMRKDIDADAALAGLKLNYEYTYRDLLYASMLPSGADATSALAYSICGSTENFVALMNKKAEELGMKNTHYVNVTGLDRDNHYSSINDVFILLKYALQNELFKTVYSTKTYRLTNVLNTYSKEYDPYLVESTVSRSSKLMNLDTSRIIGSKTGHTDNAGLCISFIFNSNGHDYLGITTKAKYTVGGRYNIKDAMSIIDYVDKNYNTHVLIEEGRSIDKIKVHLATVDNIQVKAGSDVTKYLRNDYDVSKISASYIGEKEIDYKTKKGTLLGVIQYSYDGNIIKEEEVFLNTDLKLSKRKFIEEFKYVLITMASLVILLIILIIIAIKRHKRRR